MISEKQPRELQRNKYRITEKPCRAVLAIPARNHTTISLKIPVMHMALCPLSNFITSLTIFDKYNSLIVKHFILCLLMLFTLSTNHFQIDQINLSNIISHVVNIILQVLLDLTSFKSITLGLSFKHCFSHEFHITLELLSLSLKYYTTQHYMLIILHPK